MALHPVPGEDLVTRCTRTARFMRKIAGPEGQTAGRSKDGVQG